MRWEAVALSVVLFAVLSWQFWRAREEVNAARRRVFDDCLDAIAGARITRGAAGFPSITGQYGDKPIRLDVLIDAAGFRKLPSLWLQLNIVDRLPVKGALDFLVRPSNTEFFSPSSSLPLRLALPVDWPAHALIKTDDRDAARWLPHIDAPVRDLFADLKCKELLVTPKGVRLVYQLAQAERADYLVLRALVFDNVTLAAPLFRQLMDKLLIIHSTLSRV